MISCVLVVDAHQKISCSLFVVLVTVVVFVLVLVLVVASLGRGWRLRKLIGRDWVHAGLSSTAALTLATLKRVSLCNDWVAWRTVFGQQVVLVDVM